MKSAAYESHRIRWRKIVTVELVSAAPGVMRWPFCYIRTCVWRRGNCSSLPRRAGL